MFHSGAGLLNSMHSAFSWALQRLACYLVVVLKRLTPHHVRLDRVDIKPNESADHILIYITIQAWKGRSRELGVCNFQLLQRLQNYNQNRTRCDNRSLSSFDSFIATTSEPFFSIFDNDNKNSVKRNCQCSWKNADLSLIICLEN